MAAEITVTCPGCGYAARVPTNALRRNNSYCSRCGKQLPLDTVHVPMDPIGGASTASRPKRPYRSGKRR